MRETEIFFLQRVEIENETMIKLEKKMKGHFSLLFNVAQQTKCVANS